MSTVGDALSKLTCSVNDFIENQNKELKGTRSNAIELATDVSIAIGNAKTAWTYSGDLNKLESAVDEKVRARLLSLNGFIQCLSLKGASSLANLSSQIQRFNDSLPLQKWHPNLKGIFSRYVFAEPTSAFQFGFEVSFHENFAFLTSCSLSLPELGGKVTCSKSRIDMLTFKIDGLKRNFFSQIPKDGCKFVKGVLTVQYDTGGWFSDIKEAIYPIWIGIYPLHPGKISLTYPMEKVVEVKEQPFRSPTMNLSRDHFPNEGPKERKITLYPTSGWKIKTSDQPQIFCNGAPSTIVPDRFNEELLNVTLALPDGQDKADYSVTFGETKEVREVRDHTEQVELEWGSFHPISSNKFAVQFNSFDGQSFDFTSEDLKEIPYLKVRHRAGQTELVAEIPKSKD